MSLSCHRQLGWAMLGRMSFSGITLSLLRGSGICACPCPQVLAVVPAWLSRTQPQAAHGGSSSSQVSVQWVCFGDFPCFQTLHEEVECGTRL